jgi:hypothetical protein
LLINKHFLKESSRETNKAEGFADDASALTLGDKDSVRAVKNTLEEFSLISGLVCNFEKSSITLIGCHTSTNWLADCGFVAADSFKLLGVNLSNNLDDLQNNFELCYEKIMVQIRFWERFRLSLPGRITIAKTFFIQQINHLGCILMPIDSILNKIQTAIDKFCIGPLNISKERLYLDVDKGGIGLFNLKNFLWAQQVNWIKRAAVSTRDNWSFDLNLKTFGNVFTLSTASFLENQNPILHGLSVAWVNFYRNFILTDNNYRYSYLLNNPVFLAYEENFFSSIHFLASGMPKMHNIAKLTFDNCFDGTCNIRTLGDLNQRYDLNIPFVTYFRLRQAIAKIKNEFSSVPNTNSTSIEKFFGSFKKGSKKNRFFFIS